MLTSYNANKLQVYNSQAGLAGDDFVLIGGYESGVDAAVNLAKAGKRAQVTSYELLVTSHSLLV